MLVNVKYEVCQTFDLSAIVYVKHSLQQFSLI